MLDIRFIRQNPKKIKEGCRKKQVKVDVDKLLELDDEKKELLQKVENLRHRLNVISETGQKPNKEEIKKARKIKDELKELEKKLRKTEKEFNYLMLQVPIPPAADVPEGKREEENVPIKFWGKRPKFDFPIKDHITLMEDLDLLDLERGAKIGGFRQYVIQNEAVLI